jgi:DNA-binding MarR family transcriptional regulator
MREQILGYLKYTYGQWPTATEIAKDLGLKADNTSSVLKKLFNESVVVRRIAGPRGGRGYMLSEYELKYSREHPSSN